MDLICYLHPGWAPLIRPAEATRDWMTATPELFAYRCLPLNIANAHGWEVLTPCAFDAIWNGGAGADAVQFRLPPGVDPAMAPVSIFGQGVMTFHIQGLFRTEPGWNLWIGGSPNAFKDAIQPLTGVMETDWAPFTFTMNWRFTRPNTWVHFDAQEPICFFFPLRRGYLNEVAPRFEPLDGAPETMAQFKAWSAARDEFHARMAREAPKAGADRWQKHYYRGVDVSGRSHVADHQTKLRLAPFEGGARPMAAPVQAEPRANASPATSAQPADATLPPSRDDELRRASLALRKREWLLDALEQHRQLAPSAAEIERRVALGSDEFLDQYYSAGRPVILAGEMEDWPALSRWTPAYLKEAVGSAVVEYQGDRSTSAEFEMYKDAHRREIPFDRLIDLITSAAGNDAYITAYNSARNTEALAVLDRDLGSLDRFLVSTPDQHMMKWIGPSGTVTSLHHDLTNNLIAQIVGRKRIKLIPAAEVGKLYNSQHVFSEIPDLDDPALDRSRFPLLSTVRSYDVTLAPGEAIFVPLGWWHQVKSLDFSVTLTYTNFRWRNDWAQTYPTGG